ncbi:MAG: polysaccharide biosynthesis tyrosine autokinase [Prosthecobacter sp.]
MTPTKKGFDFVALTSKALQYARHGRLMVAMACLGILAGLVYYVYETPVFQAKSQVYVRSFGSPLRSNEVAETAQSGTLNRFLAREFSSQRYIVGAARRMGLVGKNATYEDVVQHVPSVQAGFLDGSHLEVVVLAKSAEVVRGFAAAMVAEYQAQQEETWAQYRDQALERYSKELKALESKATEGLRNLNKFERDGKITESAIEQTRLNELPKDIVITKELLNRMADVRRKLNTLPRLETGELALPEVLEELSLLTAFDKDREVKVGHMMRKPLAAGSTPVLEQNIKSSTEVIVQPGMVENLYSWQELEKERRILEDQQKESAKQFLPEHVVMKELAEKLASNERGLRAELAVMRQRFDLEEVHFKEKLVLLEKRMPDYYKINEELGMTSQAYSDMEKNKELWDKAREHLANKVAVIAFSENQNWIEMRYEGHTSLRDEIPVSPNKMKLLSLSLLLALGGALGVPTLVNLMDSSVSTLQQLEDATGAKGIGIVPHTDKELLEDVCRSPAVGAKVPNYLLENFRLVRSHIVLQPGRAGRTQVVMVTSARPSEGKTSQAANLGWAFQSMGARTLLIDCDLRRGRVHDFTKVSNELGMTRLLQGHCSVEDAIQKSAVPLLDIIPRGPIVVGTTDLLVQPVFFNLLERLRGEYDQIIVDTPPVLGLSETSSLQKAVDGVVFVVRAEKTSRKDVVDGVTQLRKAGAHLFGLVLNDLDLTRVSNYYNYYYYSASYYSDLDRPDDDPPSSEGQQPAMVKFFDPA